jgi:DNA repair ATPase RecN
MSEGTHEELDDYEFDYGIVVAMLGLLADDLVLALELDEARNQALIYEWETAFAAAQETQEGVEELQRVLDRMWARIQELDTTDLNPEEQAILANAQHGWGEAARNDDPAPFGEFD